MDDSPLALALLKRMLRTSPDIEVVGTARSGREALTLFEAARPDVICTDYLMPDMDGLALIQQTMTTFARPILVISSAIDPAERHQAFPLLAAGAVDVAAKPDGNEPFEQTAAELVRKVKLVSGVAVISRRAPASGANANPNAGSSAARGSRPAAPPVLQPRKTNSIRIVAIGASTGGPQVLQTILSGLPANFGPPILCVQHISRGFLDGLVEWLASQCRVRVKIAANGEPALPGTVYFPQENTHLEIDKAGRLSCSDTPPVDGHKPSATTTFESVARCYGHSALGVLLTGMGSDGASGLESIMRAGGTTMAQDEASCVVFGMPQQAIARGAAHFVLPPAEITQSLLRLTSAS